MASRFQAVSLVASPSYPNSVAWSAENFVAVASGHIVTIMNPAIPFGPKGLITIPTSKPFPIGVIERKDLLSECLLPTCLSRDIRSCVRSISWSPVGFAPNAGCLLAICTTEGIVKVYRSPFREFSPEWVEIMDVSEMLHNYFAKIRYGEADFRSSENSERKVDGEQGCNDDQPIQDLETNHKDKKQRLEQEKPLISAEQYASRNAMLSSLIVSWSPVISNNLSNGCSILAIGAKSGRISLWRVHEPQCYSITQQRIKGGGAMFLGSIKGHRSWVTAISWSEFVFHGLTQLLLSTGSSDGSVKIWRGYTDELLNSTEDCNASFSLLKEVSNVGVGPVSVLSLVVPNTSQHKIFLAIGKGSGSLEVWTYDTSIDKFDVIGPHYAHDQIVTGLVWAYGGRCLYSCSQDNSLRCWIVNGESLDEVAIPSNILGLRSSSDVPTVSDACFGVAVSPANLALAVARSFDVNLLHPMYEARSHKAAVEFFWIGGQNIDTKKDPNFDVKKFQNLHDFPDTDLVSWARNMVWSLNEYEHLDKPLVLWDIVGPLLSFKQSKVNFIDQILVKWLTLNSESVLAHLRSCLSNLTVRKLHILNIINRHVILKEDKADGEEKVFEEEKLGLWLEILEMSEKELRERLIGCSFSAAINLVSHWPIDEYKNGYWKPFGLAQMKQWVTNNGRYVKDDVKRLASQVTKNKKRIRSICKYETEEECSYCSAPVHFEHTEVAFCQEHKMSRCAVTMTVCPLFPPWFCVCCHRWVSNLAPQSFFNYKNATFDSNAIEILSKPLCPFCGILLQKLQPEFLLSTSPV